MSVMPLMNSLITVLVMLLMNSLITVSVDAVKEHPQTMSVDAVKEHRKSSNDFFKPSMITWYEASSFWVHICAYSCASQSHREYIWIKKIYDPGLVLSLHKPQEQMTLHSRQISHGWKSLKGRKAPFMASTGSSHSQIWSIVWKPVTLTYCWGSQSMERNYCAQQCIAMEAPAAAP